jgi:hypothetical protein
MTARVFLERCLTRLGIRSAKRALDAKRSWLLYVMDDFPACEFYVSIWRQVLGFRHVQEIVDCEELGRISMSIPFLYIGHGDHDGVFRREGIGYGVRNRLSNQQDINRWPMTPLVFWACLSARWLRSIARADWLGFDDYVGCDMRGAQGSWWRLRMTRLCNVIVDVVERRDNPGTVRIVAEENYKAALDDYANRRGISYLSVIFARLLSEGVRLGDGFGKAS